MLEANEKLVLEEGDRMLGPAARARLERIAGRLQAYDPQLEFVPAEWFIELTWVDDTSI